MSQTGSGIFNKVRGFFGKKQTRKVSPKPKETGKKALSPKRLSRQTKKHTAREPSLNEYETVLPYTYRMFLFWYSRINPEKADLLLTKIGSPLRYIPLNSSQKRLTPEQKKVLLELTTLVFTGANGNIDSAETFAQLLFDTDLATFEKEMREYEAPGQQIYDPIKKHTVIAESYAKGLARLAPLLRKSERNLEYFSNWSGSTCGFTPEMVEKKFTTFQSDICIPILSTNENGWEQVLSSFSAGTNRPMKNYLPPTFPMLVVKEQFMPTVTNRRATFTLTLAKKLPTVAWIQDAFRSNGVLDIQEDLAEVFRREAPDLWNASLWVTLAKLSRLETIQFEKEKYILTDNSVFPTEHIFVNLDFLAQTKQNYKDRAKRILYLQKKQQSLVLNLLTNRKIYGVDATTSIYLRKFFPTEWSLLTKDPNLGRFQDLPFPTQFLLAQLQQKAYIQRLFSPLCSSNANTTIQNNSNETPIRKEAAKYAMKIYSLPLNELSTQDELLQSIQNPEDEQLFRKILQTI